MSEMTREELIDELSNMEFSERKWMYRQAIYDRCMRSLIEMSSEEQKALEQEVSSCSFEKTLKKIFKDKDSK